MQEIPSKFQPADVENKWYQAWLDNNMFHSVPDDREAYTIVIPPPNVTGVLHMGHMLNNTIQDVLIRRARMLGKNACWVPGTDHASIATEAKVVKMLAEQGLNKQEVGRDQFLLHAFEWKDKYGGIILEQLKRLGCSCDWDRTRFTMEPALSESVIKVFIELHQKGFIYRGHRMVNWDPKGKTALSDEEVVYKEENSRLFHLQYPLVGLQGQYITIATTRPETILGDTAICVHPEDERYASIIGRKAVVPLIGREIPIIADGYVDPEFGTGALKVTPAHDENDYELGQKHQLQSIDIMNDDGTFSEAAGLFVGEDRFRVRKQIIPMLEEAGNLVKIEDIRNKVGYSERTDVVIEPRLSRQWFVDMKKFMEAHPQVLDAVMNDEIRFHPAKFKNTYANWINNIRDWCISRQLWWGQRIPAWYGPQGETFVAATADEAVFQARKQGKNYEIADLQQDEDVLDTWFSSWLWPMSVFDGLNGNEGKDYPYYYPTSDLVTAPDIIFFWVARMIMAGYAFSGQAPFKNVYFTGIVRDKQRRKMSKSLGNSPDPIELMDQFGTDGVRMGLLLSAPAGNDLLFDESLCEQGRNFCNKIWNAYRLVARWESTHNTNEWYDTYAGLATTWMKDRVSIAIGEASDHFDKYRISDALMVYYKLVWDDFCSWYLELMKPPYGEPIPDKHLSDVKEIFSDLMKLLHPFMPFISEELWHFLQPKAGFINRQAAPQRHESNGSSEKFTKLFELITAIRSLRNEKGISPKMPAEIGIQGKDLSVYHEAKGWIGKLANAQLIDHEMQQDGMKVLIGTDEVSMHFEGYTPPAVDKSEIEKELKRLKGFLIGIEKKLSNEKFLANAGEDVVTRERQKQQDTLDKIASLEKELR